MTHILTALFRFSEYDTKEKMDPHEWHEKLVLLYEEFMLSILNKFAKVAISHDVIEHKDDDYHSDKLSELKQKTIYHSYLYLKNAKTKY